MKYRFNCLLLISSIIIITGCTKDDPVVDIPASEYPSDIGKIMLTQCATSGCHNPESKDAAAGLDLSSWDKMFEGSRSGSVTVPFRNNFSPLFLFTNVHNDLGLMASPTMPLNSDPLSRDEVLAIRNWIENGAHNRNGEIKFSSPVLKKAYVVNQGCDVVAVIEPSTGLTMRYINTGSSSAIESPHMVRVSPDGDHWYVVFLGADIIQKFRASDDQLMGDIPLTGPSDPAGGAWNTFVISPDSKRAYCMDFNMGRISVVNLENMTRIATYSGFTSIHGSALNPAGDTLYVTAQTGNFIYKIPVNDFSSFEQVSLDGTTPSSIPGEDAHEILFSADGERYYVTCQGTSEIKVMRRSDDAILATVPVGYFPQEMSISEQTNKLFITCPEDQATFPGTRGSVYIMDLTTFATSSAYPGFQPHGIAADDESGHVLVANRNVNPGGPAPHHSTDCGGRNGYLSFIDLSTLTVKPKKVELSTDPYSISIRR